MDAQTNVRTDGHLRPALLGRGVDLIIIIIDIGRKIADFKLPNLYFALQLGMTPLEFQRDVWHLKTRFPAYRLTLHAYPALSRLGNSDL